jgi:hypothetical protein
MRSLAAALCALALVAGCGGSKHSETPQNALLTGVLVDGTKVTFDFKSGPQHVKARYEPRSHIVESGSGASVPLQGSAYYVVHFFPAASADIQGEKVVPTYTGPKRLKGPGPVMELAKTSDFEADLAWAIGLEKKLPAHVSQVGSTVTVSFG